MLCWITVDYVAGALDRLSDSARQRKNRKNHRQQQAESAIFKALYVNVNLYSSRDLLMSVKVPLKASEEAKNNSGKKTETKQNRYRGINLPCIHYLNVLFHLLPVFFKLRKKSLLSDITCCMPYETLIFCLWHAECEMRESLRMFSFSYFCRFQ